MPSSFQKGLDAAAASLVDPKTVKEWGRELFTKIVDATPVDTGRARDGWEIDEAPLGGITWIENSVPYIAELENGSSKQAPAGMVIKSIEEMD